MKKIIVLTGGLSRERDVSFAMGGQIAATLKKNGHCVVLLDTYMNYDFYYSFEELYNQHKNDNLDYEIPATEPDLETIKLYRGGNQLLGKNILEACCTADVCFLAQAGSISENGQLPAVLDVFGIPYTGSGQIGSLLSMDKVLAKGIVAQNGIQTPLAQVISRNITDNELERLLEKFSMPCILKPRNGGSSIGITIVKSIKDIAEAVENIRSHDDDFFIEDYIQGMNLTVGILGNKALPSVFISHNSEFNDFQTKYQGKSKLVCPAPISHSLEKKLRKLSVKIHNALQMEFYSRQDFIIDDNNNIYFLEANSRPGMTPVSAFSRAANIAGVSFSQLCEDIVAHSLERAYLKQAKHN